MDLLQFLFLKRRRKYTKNKIRWYTQRALSYIWSGNSRPKSEAKDGGILKSYKTSNLVLCAVNVVTETLTQYKLKNPELKYSILLFLRA